MSRTTRTLALATATAAVATAAQSPQLTSHATDMPRIRMATFHSAVLQKTKRLALVLPAGYAPDGGPYPVLFLFHGRGRHERSLIDNEATRRALLAFDGIVVLPDGDDGWYINSPVKAEDRYGDYMEELIRAVDEAYATSTDRRHRGLSGWSMGGYGCTWHAVTHANQFGALAPMIGLLDFPRTGLPAGFSYEVPEARFGSDPEVWDSLNPLSRAEALRGMAILVITAEQAFDRVMNEHFSDRLNDVGIAHRFEILAGGHTFAVVEKAVPKVIAFMNAAIAAGTEDP